MSAINTEVYMANSLSFRPEEETLRDSFALWLPPRIIDCHAHCGISEDVEELPSEAYWHPISTFLDYSLEESERLKGVFYPGKVVRSLRFPGVFRGINHHRANQYLLQQSAEHDRIALFGLPEDVEYTTAMMLHPRVSALKMYYLYTQPAATHVYQFFKPEILKVAEERGLPIILHLPRLIIESMDDLRCVLRDFPKLKISLAHLGPTDSLMSGLEEAFEELTRHPYLYLDTALSHSKEVIGLALRVFGTGRIMFGSDEPLHLIRGRMYVHPEKGDRLITDYPYHWVDLEDHYRFRHLVSGVSHWHWLSLEVLREAISTYPLVDQEAVKARVFYENAKEFFGF